MLFRGFAFVVALIAGMMLSQVPEFAQQYRQRLGGAIDELARIITYFDEDAARSGFTRADALALMARNNERLIRDQGARMRATIARYERLFAQQQAFAGAGPFGRLVAFFRDFDRPLVSSTLEDFEPAVPTTIEGIAFAGGGFFFAYLFLGGIRLLFYAPRRRADARSRYLSEQKTRERHPPSDSGDSHPPAPTGLDVLYRPVSAPTRDSDRSPSRPDRVSRL